MSTEVRNQSRVAAPTAPEKARNAREYIVHAAMYGSKSYVPGVDQADIVSMLAALIQMHRDELLTEGQVARATRLDRVTVRSLCDLMSEAEDK